ncbi:MAG: Fic family protein [Bdellovibrio sp.]|nr:Fic family protein [Bdellovibrio sp.]
MEYIDRKNKILQFVRVYGAISNSDVQSLTSSHRNTSTHDLKRLVDEGLLLAHGTGKGTIYRLLEDLIFPPSEIEAIFLKKEKKLFDKFFRTQDRKKVFFNKIAEKAISADFSFPKNISDKFHELKERIDTKRKELSEEARKKKKEKLVIDLSWASSNIEGNTYSLLETEGLLKYNQTAKGKNFQEAQMILNHKSAIEYIRQGSHYKTIDKQKVLELHQILMQNLNIDTGFREHLVTISNSSFVPCDNKFQIISFFDLLTTKINKMKSALDKAVAANLLLAFLQPFSDGNKRTSRMLGNSILLSYNYIPISFVNTPKEDYIKAILYFYEKQKPDFFKQLFLNELNNSFREYIG